MTMPSNRGMVTLARRLGFTVDIQMVANNIMSISQ
jgi:hypothetical protein